MLLGNVCPRLASEHFEKVVANRKPDVVISKTNGGIYLRRWYIIPRNRFFNIYLHEFHDSDDDRAVHDHPWSSVGWLLHNGYEELRRLSSGTEVCHTFCAGDVIYRPANYSHRIIIDQKVLTLFCTGPRYRDWGFWCGAAWKSSSQFLEVDPVTGQTYGCEEP